MKLKIKAVLFIGTYVLLLMCNSLNKIKYTTEVTYISDGTSYSEVLVYEGSRLSADKFFSSKSISSSNESSVNISNGIINAKQAGSALVCSEGKEILFRVFLRPCVTRKKYKIVVYKGSQIVTVYASDQNGNYNIPVKSMLCSTGSEGKNETICGTYSVRKHYRWQLLYGPCYGQYCTSFSPSYLFHSLPYSKISPDSVCDYELLGQKSSHGCIRLCVRDAKWIYEHCDVASTVIVTDEEYDVQIKPLRAIDDNRFYGWDPTDPDINNPYIYYGLQTEPICEASGTRINLLKGETVKIPIYTTAKNIKVTSDNISVVKADNNAKITATGTGSCTVYIWGDDGSDCSIAVTVK